MNVQNKSTKSDNNKGEDKDRPLKETHVHTSGLDEWNDRLDKNLENEDQGNPSADESARIYQDEEDK